MKADLTKPEVRAAFMALYYGQPVRYEDREFKEVTFNFLKWIRFEKLDQPLFLRPISSLTKEELYKIVKLIETYRPVKEQLIYIEKERIRYMIELQYEYSERSISLKPEQMPSIIADALREIGILIPFRGNNVEEIIESGLAVYQKEGE